MNVIVWSLIISFLWGLSPTIHKKVLSDLHPHIVLVISGVVYFIALIVLMLYNIELLMKEGKKVRAKHLGWLAATTVGCTFFGSIIYYHVLSKHDSHVVTAIAYSSPVFTLILAYLFLNEKISLLGCIGVLMIVAGVVCIGFNDLQAQHK
jgi:uncharacterized membrane protein